MNEYINKEKLLEVRPFTVCAGRINDYDEGFLDCAEEARDAVKDFPAADVVPVKHGKWLHTDYALHWTAKDECSECTYHALDRDDLSHYNYCPNCGAKMDEDDIHE